MTNLLHKKIVIVGPPGSGKTYFSHKLSECFDLPLIHLDSIYYDESGKSIGDEAFIVALKDLLTKDEGIIEGFYLNTLPDRLSWADIIFFLDLNKEDVYQGLNDRKEFKSDDCYLNRDGEIDSFPQWWNTYETRLRQTVYNYLKDYTDKSIIFHSRKEIDEYIEDLLKGK